MCTGTWWQATPTAASRPGGGYHSLVSRLLLATLALPLAACGAIDVHVPEGRPRGVAALGSDVATRFAYELVSSAELERSWVDALADVSSGSLTIRLADEAETTQIKFQFWRSQEALEKWGPRAPAVIVTPILGGGQSISRSQCRYLVEAGFHVALVDRGPRVMAAHWPIDALELYMRRGIAGRRAMVDWLSAREDVDPTRISAMGISMGGIITAVFTAVEPRLESAVIALAGADVPAIIRVSSENRLIIWREARAAELGGDLAEVEARLRGAFPDDPGVLARAIDPRKVLQVTASLDTVVPAERQEELWEALGRPLRYDLPTGHYTGIVYLPYILETCVDWWKARYRQESAAK